MTTKKEEKIKNDYINGMHYKDIFKKYNITLSDLNKIKHKYKLIRKKSEVLKGNKNAYKNKGGHPPKGNKNAVTTGEYEGIYKDVLSEEEKKIFKSYNLKDDKNEDELLMNEYLEEYKLLTIREIRMMNRIKKLEQENNDLTIKNIKKKNAQGSIETTTEAESTINIIQKIEDALTRVTESKRKSRENMIKLGFNLRELKIKEKQAEQEMW